jgi:uncharacterized protein (UPF0332 family)
MNPRLFLELARFFANSSGLPFDRASFRSAISRAYYAAYHVAVRFLATIHVEIKEPAKGHDAVRQAFLFCSDPLAKEIGVMLRTLHTQRKWADYELDNPDPEERETAKAACSQATSTIKKLELCESPPQLATMLAKVKRWVEDHPACGLRNN